jgi:hypothetical protein
VFTADFGSARQWVAGRSWAYPDAGPVNPGDDKLDHLVSDASYARSGVFRATRRSDGYWDTGLLTTEASEEAFTVRSGDVLEARVRLPGEIGAWPAIWTWRDGDQEIDVFEYHLEHPDRVRGTLGRLVGERRSGLRGPAGSGAPLARLPHRQPLGLRGPLSPGARRGEGPRCR